MTQVELEQKSTDKPFWQKFFYGAGCIFELTKWIVILIVIGTLVHLYVGTLFIVDGASMDPNYQSGQYILVNRWTYHFGKPLRGDAVVLRFPGDPEHKKYIKRIIGLPGETVEIKNGSVYVNGNVLRESYIPSGVLTEPDSIKILEKEDYYLLGDNRYNSSDSRIWGICPKRDLIGKAVYTIYPFNIFGAIEQAKY